MAESNLRIVLRAQDDASAVMRNLGRSTNELAANLIKGAAAGVGFALTTQITSALGNAMHGATDAIIGFNASLEQSRVAWATMLGGAAEANAMLAQLQQFAATTPFEFPDVERAAKRLTAMGFAADSIIPLLTDVGNAAAALGAGTEGIDRITLALGQMSSRTKVSAQDMLQLTEVGVPAWRILAEATGKSIADVQDAASKGEISSQVFIDAFRRFSQANYGGLMEKQSQTFSGAVSTIRDQVRLTLAQAFEPLFKGLSGLTLAFANFTQSPAFKEWGTNFRTAQLAVGLFLSKVAESGPLLDVMKGALAGVATVMAVQFTAAAARAIVSLSLMTAAFVAANAPMIAIGAAAALAGVLVVANWDQISQAATEFAKNVGDRLGELANWLSDTFAPVVAGAAQAGWESFANNAIGALNAVGGAWDAFWNTIGPSGQTAFEQLQEQARTGWAGFVKAATDAFENVIAFWNGMVTALAQLQLAGAPLPGIWGVIAGKTIELDSATKTFTATLEAIPGVVVKSFTALQKFVAEDIPAAVQRAVALVQAAGTDIAQIVPAIIAELQQKATEITDAFGSLGGKAGAAFADSVTKIARPLVEELARMQAQLAAGPATAALEDTQARIERNKLLLQVRGVAPEDRAAARREIRDLTRNVLPGQQLTAFDFNRNVQLATRVEQTITLQNQILQNWRDQQAGTKGGGAATAGAGSAVSVPAGVTPAGGATTLRNDADLLMTLAKLSDAQVGLQGNILAELRGRQPISLHLEVKTDGGTARTIDQLIEATPQAQMPPVIQVSGVRR